MKTSIHFLKNIIASLFIIGINYAASADSSSMKPIVHHFSVEHMHAGEALITLRAEGISDRGDHLIVRKNEAENTIVSKMELQSGVSESIMIVDRLEGQKVTTYSVIVRSADGTEIPLETIVLPPAKVDSQGASEMRSYNLGDPHQVSDLSMK